MKIIISDTTTPMILAKCDAMNLLTNFLEKVYVPKEVMKELCSKDDQVKFVILSSDFIEVKEVSDQQILDEIKTSNLDRGEIEAIALALEMDLDLIIDEKAGRKYAKSKGIGVLGLLGILKINLINKHITYLELLYMLDEFKRVNFRISPKLEKYFLESLHQMKI